MTINGKRKGFIAPLLALAIVGSIVVTSFMVQFSKTHSEESQYLTYYNVSSMATMLSNEAISYISRIRVDVPKSPISSVYDYDKALEMLPTNFEIYMTDYIGSIDNIEIREAFRKCNLEDTSYISFAEIRGDFNNFQNKLYFESGDRLYLKDVSFNIIIKTKNKAHIFTYILSDLYAYVEVLETSFNLQINSEGVTVSEKT